MSKMKKQTRMIHLKMIIYLLYFQIFKKYCEKKEQICALNENSVFSLHFLTDVLKKKLISIKHAKK